MPPWLTEVLKLVGVTTPLLYGAATYGFFHYLDKKASGSAKKAISMWLEQFNYEKTSVATALVEVFERVYAKSLFSLRAAGRSAAFTILVTVIFLYEANLLPILLYMVRERSAAGAIGILLINIFSDYSALFVIKPILMMGGRRPALALALGTLAGIAIVLLNYIFFSAAAYIQLSIGLLTTARELKLASFGGLQDYIIETLTSNFFQVTLLAGLMVHFWIPLLAFSVLFLQILNYLMRVIKSVQWFLKQGRNHPLDAIGYVAAILIFVIATTIHFAVS